MPQHWLWGNPTAGLPTEPMFKVNLCNILLHHLVHQRFNLLAPSLQEGKKQPLPGEAVTFPSSHHSAAK